MDMTKALSLLPGVATPEHEALANLQKLVDADMVCRFQTLGMPHGTADRARAMVGAEHASRIAEFQPPT